MTTKRLSVGMLLGLAAILFCAAGEIARAQSSASPALAGLVSSQEEGPMEGVLVSAKRAGATLAVTVVTDDKGRYSFPRNRLAAGQYNLRLRAVGYETEGPAQTELAAQKPAQF